MSDKVQLIRQEVERLIDIEEETSHLDKVSFNSGRWKALTQLKVFIDSLPEEPVSEDLEEAAKQHSKQVFHGLLIEDNIIAFKAGAEWQKQQMMKNAVETTIVNDWQYGKDPDHAIIPAIHQRIERLDVGDKAKIIIIKPD